LLFPETVEFTVDWYRSWHEKRVPMRELATAQIDRYTALAAQREIAWSTR
jgi:hypothetical protein